MKERIAALPTGPGVYLFLNREKIPVYIGKAVSIKKRVQSHFRYFGESFTKEGVMLAEVRAIQTIETPTEAEALLLEASLVKESQPRYNQELKDDKSYPFLKITSEEFPRLLVVRGRKGDGAKYFGPYTSAHLLKKAVTMLRRLFPMRTCQPIPKKVCLMYHIGQCKGPCVGEIGKSEYGEIVKELGYFLEGRRDAMVRSLTKRMKEHSARKEYEKAKLLYEEIRALSSIRVPTPKPSVNVLEGLKDLFSLKAPPKRIEGFDISNISGKEAVGSMVVFIDARPARSEYRRFRIQTVKGIDDYEMMREVVRRRYARLLEEKAPLPDLVLIDGGKGHLGAAKGVLDELGLDRLPILSIAKQHEHLYSPAKPGPTVLPQSSPILQLFQHIRDEAHRFAITYHRRLHKKEAMISVLDGIPGVGPATRDRLIKKFGSAKQIARHSEEELSSRGGVRPGLAARILQELRRAGL
ncbi:MAG TPA: excinuclease ABC subunit UvrC [Candidatus Omnitrophota bacterium]|nr:excinuclease ABC subunit UvrC [Candidatus Omnitrophota bacterium]